MTSLKKIISCFAVISLSCILSTPTAAEVMDKEMSISSIWMWSFVGSIFGFFLTKYRLWVGVINLLLFCTILYSPISEWHDPFVGPAIATEAGKNYGMKAYAAICFLILSHLAGWAIKQYIIVRTKHSTGNRKPRGF